MKVGILTFHNVVNYGGTLQSYALQKKMNTIGYDTEVVDYQCEEFRKFYSPFNIEDGSLRKICYMIYAFPQRCICNKKFRDFVYKFIKVSKVKYTRDTIKETDKIYDAFISGSDQVWNLELTDNDKTYLLDFTKPEKRVSYAASFGFSKIPAKYEDTYRNELRKFRFVSVREVKGKEILKDLDVEAQVNIDPVFLLNKNEWSELFYDNKMKEDYICVYKINKSDCYQIAKELSQKTGLKVVVIKPDKTCPLEFIRKRYASPVDFVNFFGKATYVITDSFHGTAFSVLFNKQFVVSLDKSANNRNSRQTNLLNKMGLDERIAKDDIAALRIIDKDINYEAVNQIIEADRKITCDYLNHAMQEIGKNEGI